MIKFYIILVIAVFIFIFGCSDNMINSTDDVVFPEENISYQQHVEPFLKLTCAYGQCHDATGLNGDDFTSYFMVMSSTGTVIPGNPEQSNLIQMIENPFRHPVFFYSGDINDNHITGMKKWVEEGAKFN